MRIHTNLFYEVGGISRATIVTAVSGAVSVQFCQLNQAKLVLHNIQITLRNADSMITLNL